MKHDLASIKAGLAVAPSIVIRDKLIRLVPFFPLNSYNPPNWLYASGRANRYNPAGVKCIYLGETKEVANVEYEAGMRGTGKHQPVTLYTIEVVLHRVLDVTAASTLKLLQFDARDLSENWRRRTKNPTATQLLGLAVNETQLFSAIRYPSKAAATAGSSGINYVIFQDCVKNPDSVRVLGPTCKELQSWP